MPEYTLSAELLKTKRSKIILGVIILVLFGGVIYARLNGVSLHIKTGQITGTPYTVTEYLDNQDYIEGRVTTTIPDGRGSYYVQLGDTVIDVTKVMQATNSAYPVDHFIKGDIKPGVRIKAIVRKSDPIEALKSYNINNWFEAWPSDPFYIEVE